MVKKFRTISSPLLDSLKKVEEELTQPKAVTDYDLFNLFPRSRLKGAKTPAAQQAAVIEHWKRQLTLLNGADCVQLLLDYK